jgi:hypothetical protein
MVRRSLVQTRPMTEVDAICETLQSRLAARQRPTDPADGLTQQERRDLRCDCTRLDDEWHHVRFCPVPVVERILAARQRPTDRWFTADEVVEIANETSDSFGNLYRLDFIDRIRHEEARS